MSRFILNGKDLYGTNDNTTVLTQTLAASATSLTFTNAAIKTTCMYDVYCDVFGVNPSNMVITTGQAVLTFPAQQSSVNVRLIVKEV